MSSDSLSRKAIKTSNLVNRAETNLKYGSKDFTAWTKSLLGELRYTSVLDLCCGTGNQLVLYAENPEVQRMIGVDLSKQSLETAGQRLGNIRHNKELSLLALPMEQMFSDPALSIQTFDLISCFYGLYYSKDVARTLSEMVAHLSDEGAVLIVGPFGNNNKSLFDVLQRFYKLPELVLRSASTFMENEVLSFLRKVCAVEAETFINYIEYPDIDSLMHYWRSSTFYFPEHERLVREAFRDHFNEKLSFVVEKHIMAIRGTKK